MLRRASAYMMPSDAERATRNHEKKLAEKKAELQKQARLADRRALICNAALNVLPRNDRPELPDTPIMRSFTNLTVSEASAPRRKSSTTTCQPIVDEKTYETPFKGARRQNPLTEKKDRVKAEEHRRIAEISAEQNVNKSQAKVLLAQNPILQRPVSVRRTSSSDSNRSYVPALRSPLASSFVEMDPSLAAIPLSGVPTDTGLKAQKLMGLPLGLVARDSQSSSRSGNTPADAKGARRNTTTPHHANGRPAAVQSGSYFDAQSSSSSCSTHSGSPSSPAFSSPLGQSQYTASSAADAGKSASASSGSRRQLRRLDSTMSVDTTLVRNGASLHRTNTSATYLSTVSVSPSVSTFGGASSYTASLYSPVVHFQEPPTTPGREDDDDFDEGEILRTPRAVNQEFGGGDGDRGVAIVRGVRIPLTAPLVPSGSSGSQGRFVERFEVSRGEVDVSESLLYDMSRAA